MAVAAMVAAAAAAALLSAAHYSTSDGELFLSRADGLGGHGLFSLSHFLGTSFQILKQTLSPDHLNSGARG